MMNGLLFVLGSTSSSTTSSSVADSTATSSDALWEINSFGDAALFSLICILIVFVVLALISGIVALMNKDPHLEDPMHATMKNGTELDDDAMAAVIVATMEFRRTKKQDCKVLSVELVEDEKAEKKKAKEAQKEAQKASKEKQK